MDTYDETTYGERIAQIYDELYAEVEDETIDLLQELANGGKALELGIGTGRVALPLYRRGVPVTGIDASQSMITRLRAKPDGGALQVVHGSFAEINIDEEFDLIYVVFNTFYNLRNQDEQVHCFRSIAEHLTPDGVFLVEAFVPDLTRFDRNQTVRAINLDNDRVRLDVSRHDPVAQNVISQHVHISAKGIQLYPVNLRYVWPSEFDLMARLSGLERKQRWGSWNKQEFSAESGKHISVYGRPV
jgi:SAM-dependent methyltransferase